MISDSDIHLSNLDGVLEGFTIETSMDFKSKILNNLSSQSEINVGSNASVGVLRNGEEITICELFGPVATKGGPKVHPR